MRSRTPQGVRGLKRRCPPLRRVGIQSHSARSAWIETYRGGFPADDTQGRTPQGVRGLKLEKMTTKLDDQSRTPQGVRGLKLKTAQSSTGKKASHSARSAWIETGYRVSYLSKYPGRTPQGVRGLKHQPRRQGGRLARSHSARSAWIET